MSKPATKTTTLECGGVSVRWQTLDSIEVWTDSGHGETRNSVTLTQGQARALATLILREVKP